MQAVDAFVHAITTLWERLQPRRPGISIPKKLAAEAAPTGLPRGSRPHGLRRSGAAAARGVGDVARERAAACAPRAVGYGRQSGCAETPPHGCVLDQPHGERCARVTEQHEHLIQARTM